MQSVKQKRKRTGTACIVIGLLLMAAALSLTLYNRWDANRADRAAQEVVTKLKAEIPSQVTDSDRDMPTIEFDGNRYIGILEIPALDLTLPVMEDWDYEKLKTAPCRYSGSYYTDDLVIAGHNYARHFSPLKWIDVGSDIYFTSVIGQVYHYTVSNVETLQPAQVEDMTAGDWDLTLFTCNTGGQSRCTVRCIKVD